RAGNRSRFLASGSDTEKYDEAKHDDSAADRSDLLRLQSHPILPCGSRNLLPGPKGTAIWDLAEYAILVRARNGKSFKTAPQTAAVSDHCKSKNLIGRSPKIKPALEEYSFPDRYF